MARTFTGIESDRDSWLGYAELGQALGRRGLDGKLKPLSRSTIERMVRDGSLPAPQKIRGRSVWAASIIEQREQERVAAQVRGAAKGLDDVPQDQAGELAVRLAARALNAKPEEVAFMKLRHLSPAEAAALRHQAEALLDFSPFAHLPAEAQVVAALHLCPALREAFEKGSVEIPDVPSAADLSERFKAIVKSMGRTAD